MTPGLLAGRHVLVVEDDPIIAMTQTTILEDAGCVVLGPAPGVDQALRMVAGDRVDLALLDVSLGSETVYPVADALAERGVPFVFLTGYSTEILPPAHKGRRCLRKPCDDDELLAALRAALDAKRKTAS
jgi:two-component system, chemotaxis family, sensor kinase Cph1